MDIYLSQGYTEREAAQSILAHNLYGLDIDDRAYQLTYFSLMMKARQYDRRLFSRDLRPQVCAIEESNGLTKWSDMRGQVEAEQMSLEDQFVNLADELIDTFQDAKNYGSLLQVEPGNYDGLLDYMQQLLDKGCNNLFLSGWLQEVAERMPKLVRQAKLLRQKYWVCVTNPPYLGSGSFNAAMNQFAKKKFPDSKSDLFAMFMERCNAFVKTNGIQAMITQHAWMFLSSYEKLREKVLQKTIVNMAHLEPRAFDEIGGEVVQTTAFVVLQLKVPAFKGTYCRLVKPTSQQAKEKLFLTGDSRYTAQQESFAKIPGEPIAYWLSNEEISLFDIKNKIGDIAISDGQNKTGDNDKYIRYFWEVNSHLVGPKKKWILLAKGGGFRRWSGNIQNVINWDVKVREHYRRDHVARIIPEYPDPSALGFICLDMAGLITAKQPTLAERYEQFKAVCEDRFDILKDNEEELNRIFIDIYGLQDELTLDVAPKDVTVHRIFDSKDDVPDDLQGSNYVLTKEGVMKSLLSYAVGCLFGRYSLDTPGLAYAGGEWDAGKYQTFIPDDDNVVPITDEEYFDDDLPSFICAWLKKAFGRENFESNLEFLTDALRTRGTTPKEKLRNYFLKNFYKDHCKTYQKRPIYWLFDSGKENGFKAFVYIYRWTQDTEGRVLLYLHKVQSKYETELRAIDMNLENLSDKGRAARLEKRKDYLQKQLAEIKDYDEILDHMANEQLTMDLDDGVKVNYEKMQTDREGVTYPILAKIK